MLAKAGAKAATSGGKGGKGGLLSAAAGAAAGGKKGKGGLLSAAAGAASGGKKGKKSGGLFGSLGKMAKGALKKASGALNAATGGLLGTKSNNCGPGQKETTVGEVTICAADVDPNNHCGANTYFSEGMCNPCAPDEYSEPGATTCLKGTAPTNSKKKCGPGTHWDTVAKLCTRCKNGFSSGFESLKCTELESDELTAALDLPANDCGPNTFKSAAGSCDRCDAGKSSAPGSTFCVDVPPSAGDNGCGPATFFVPSTAPAASNGAAAPGGYCYSCPPKHTSLAGSTVCTPMGEIDTKNVANGLAAIQSQLTALTANLGGAAGNAPAASSADPNAPAADPNAPADAAADPNAPADVAATA